MAFMPSTGGGATEIPMQGRIFDLGAAYEDAQKIQSGQLGLEEATALAPIKIAQAQRESDLSNQQYGNAMMAQIAQQANAADDPQAAAQIWDNGMRQLSQKGFDNASQYVGHYRRDLATNVFNSFSGKGSAGGEGPTGPDPVVLYRSMSQLTPDQLKSVVQNQNRVITGFNNVKDAASLRAEVDALKEAGVDVSSMLGGLDLNDNSPAGFAKNYAVVTKLVNSIVPFRDTAAQILAEQTTGAPLVGPSYMSESGFAGGRGRMPPNARIIGYTADGRPEYENPMDPTQVIIGDTAVATKTPGGPASVQRFDHLRDAYRQAHPNDPNVEEDALNFAGGKLKSDMTPDQITAYAQGAADREVAAHGQDLTPWNPPGGVEAWRANRVKQIEAEFPSMQGTGGGTNAKPQYSAGEIAAAQQAAIRAARPRNQGGLGKDPAAVRRKLQEAGIPIPKGL
jgi:hypothetical protein